MVAFYGSFTGLIVVVALVFRYGSKRAVGTPVTWGEAMVGGAAVFAIFFLAYGMVPHAFLVWADGKTLNWRSDAFGIPAGPLNKILNKKWENHWYSGAKNTFFPQGVTFGGRGRVKIDKQKIRDVVAATLYIVFLGVHIFLWGAWQKRGRKAADKAAIEPVSSYGRPLVKKA